MSPADAIIIASLVSRCCCSCCCSASSWDVIIVTIGASKQLCAKLSVEWQGSVTVISYSSCDQSKEFILEKQKYYKFGSSCRTYRLVVFSLPSALTDKSVTKATSRSNSDCEDNFFMNYVCKMTSTAQSRRNHCTNSSLADEVLYDESYMCMCIITYPGVTAIYRSHVYYGKGCKNRLRIRL